MEYDSKKIGQKIAIYRITNNMSQKDLAVKCELSQTYINTLEKGKNKSLSMNTLCTIANFLNIGIDSLLEDNLEVFNEHKSDDILYNDIKNHLEVLSVEDLKSLAVFVSGFEKLKGLYEKDE